MSTGEMPRKVRDFFDSPFGTQEDFVRAYQHPFLVLVNVGRSDGDGDYFTSASVSVERILAISQGRWLKPDAPVYPVTKRVGANPYEDIVMLGRATNCDIVIELGAVSKLHFFTLRDPMNPERYLVGDAGSRNGTKLNGAPLVAKERQPISSGDRLDLGDVVTFRFYQPAGLWEVLSQSQPSKPPLGRS